MDWLWEKVGEEVNVGTDARDKNRQAWRANVGGEEGETGATEEAKKKLEELKEIEKDAAK